MIDRILLFGDTCGLSMLLRILPSEVVCGIVAAGIRPQYHDEMKSIAHAINVPFAIQPLPDALDYANFVQWVRNVSPQLFLVNSYSMKLREDVLAIPEAGALNIHGALLPMYRGCNPTQWAIIRGEYRTGVTLHEMTVGIDEGSLVAQKEIPLFFEDTWRDAQQRIVIATEELLRDAVPDILSGSWSSVPQKECNAWYGKRRKPDDGFFRWEEPVVDIYNLIRSLVAPHPGAFYEDLEHRKVILDSWLSLNDVIAMKLQHQKECGFLSGQRVALTRGKREQHPGVAPQGGMEWNGMEIRTNLRSARSSDKDVLYRWMTDRELCVLNSPYFSVGEGEHDTWFASVLSRQQNAVFFVIEEKVSQKIIGTCQLVSINWVHRNAELQIRIGERTFQGKGLGSEAIRLLVNFGFTDLNLHRIYLHVFSSNIIAIRAYEKCGFVREGVLKDGVYIDGKYVDVEVMAFLKKETT